MAVKLNESQIKYLGINKKNDTTTYVLDINGTTHTNGRIYSDEWIQFNDAAKGIYWVNGNSAHLYSNNVGSYGSLIITGDRGGYNGILLGNSKDYMAVMSGTTHQGLFNESNSKWIVYYNKSTGRIGIGTSDLKEYNNTLHGSTYLNGATYINGATTVNSTLQVNNVITMTQASSAALGIDTSLKIGTAKKDLHFNITNGSGSGINDGNAGGITFGYSNNAVAGIYYQTSGSYGTRLIFGTTNSYAAGSSARMIIQNNGYVGINTLTPSYHLHVAGDVMANNFRGYLEGNARTLKDHGQHTEAASGTTGNSPTTGLLYTSGLFMTRTYTDSNTPVNYGNIINVAGAGSGQLLLEWSGTDNTPGHLYYRSHRDTSTGGWSSWITILDNNNYATHLDGTYVNVVGDTMTGLLTLWTGASHSGIKLANTYMTAISGEVIFQNNSAIRFGGDSWDYNVWAGLKYNPSNKYIYLGLADGSIFTANSSQSGGRILTPGISYLHVGNQTTYYMTDGGVINASTVYTSDWFRSYNATGWYNQTYAGGWYMTDATYVRSYNNKALLVGNNIYVGTTAGAGTGLSLHGTSSPATYGIHMSTTANYGKHGDTQSDWATYFHMNAVGQRGWIYRAGSTNVASISANGIGAFKGIMGETGHIVSPDGGRYTTTTSTVTGYLKVTLPVSWTNAMFRFAVDIYDYSSDNTVTYIIGGYNYSSDPGWHSTSAQCISKWGTSKSNLDVRFGHDGSKCAIYIGAANTSWSYPQVIVRDVLLGYGQASQIATWSRGWSVGFTTTLGSYIVTKSNTNVGYSVNYASSAGNADTTDGLHVHTGRNNEANKIVRTDGNGYIQCGYINSSNGNEGNNSSPPRVWGTNGSDNYLRTYLTSALSVNYANSTKRWDVTATNPTTTSTDNSTGYFNQSGSHIYWYTQTGLVANQPSQWGYILDIGNGSERHQIWMTQSHGNMYHRGGNGSGWGGEWRCLLDSSNYTSYALSTSYMSTNDVSTYGGLRAKTAKGGYYGIIFGDSSAGLNIMSSDPHQGLYNESKGRWILYYNRSSNIIGLGGSDISAGYTVNTNGSLYISSSTYSAGALGSGTRIYTGYDSGQSNSVSCSNWFRSSGATGWYNATYDGGWYMSDTTWVRTHNSKGVYTGTGQIRSDRVDGGMWITGTHAATFVAGVATSSAAGQYYQGWYSGKTQSGAWSLGALSGDESLYFVYGTDTNYNSSTNTTAYARISSSGQVYGAVWNDYAEYRSAETIEPGRVVQESTDGIMKLTTNRLTAGCEIISDTFGFAIGETEDCKTPVATSGRVLAYTFEDRNSFELGQAVCSGPNGTVSKMTREEIMIYPERILGTVSEIPTYTTWGTGNVNVNGRIWIRIR